MKKEVKDFFANSDGLDHMVLRPLSHILPNWELTWDHAKQQYREEEGSFAKTLNELIVELSGITPPAKYHDNEDRLADYVVNTLKWPVEKVKGRWYWDGKPMNSWDYSGLLEQGGFGDENQQNLLLAIAGRVSAAIKHGQLHFDDMELGHREILAAVLAVVLYHRSNDPDLWESN